jgi:hypothetical protein
MNLRPLTEPAVPSSSDGPPRGLLVAVGVIAAAALAASVSGLV